MFEAGFGRSHGWRRPKCRLRWPVRRWLWPEGNREAVGLAGVAFLLVTFLWPRKEKLLAQARMAGETLSRAQPSRPARRQPCHQQAPPHPQPFSHKGRREQRRSREQAPLPPWDKEAKTISGTGPPPQGRRGQRRSREKALLPQGEKEAKTISGMIPSPVGRGLG